MNAPLQARRHAWDVQRGVLLALLLREMKARVGGQWVGAVWTLFEPLAHLAILLAIFSYLRGYFVPGVEVPVFLVTGLVPYFLFSNLANRLMDGIESNRGLFSYRQVMPLDPLVARSVVEILMNFCVYVFTLGVLGWMGYHALPSSPLELLGVHALVVSLGVGFGIFAAVLTHDRPRLRSMIRMTLLPLYFISGVIFPVFAVPRDVLDWLLWNPLLHVIELSRHAFIQDYPGAEGVSASYPLGFALVLMALALSVYRADRRRLVTIT